MKPEFFSLRFYLLAAKLNNATLSLTPHFTFFIRLSFFLRRCTCLSASSLVVAVVVVVVVVVVSLAGFGCWLTCLSCSCILSCCIKVKTAVAVGG